jgi:hypothetical protein
MADWVFTVELLACAAGWTVFFYLMSLSKGSPQKMLSKEKEFRMPDMRLRYTPDQLYAIFADAGEQGLPQMRRYWLLDFGFIVFFLGVMLAIGFNVIGESSALYLPMGIAAVLRALLDMLENILLLQLAHAYPTRRDATARLTSRVTFLKFVCLYAWVGILFVRLFITAFHIAG